MSHYSTFDQTPSIPSYKSVFVGDAGCGKSSIIHKFHYNEFSSLRHSTIGGEFKSLEMQIDGKKLNLQTWDTAGQERYKSLVKLYFRGADAIVFVFDLSNETTLINIESWINEYILHSPSADDDKVPLYLVGNKKDLGNIDTRQNQFIDALIKKYNLTWFETSAKTGTNVNELFTKIATDMLENNKEKEDMEFVDIAEPDGMLNIKYWSAYLPSWGKPRCC